jgi:hypothetical protein
MLVPAISFMAALLWKPAEAKVYRCEGANGTPILTDQPKGKRGCVLVRTTTPSPPSGVTPPADPTPPIPPDLPSADLQPGALPPVGFPMHPRHPPGTEQVSPPVASQEPLMPAAPEAQHCSPRVNPFNPFAGMNCSPAAGNSSETQTP